MSANDPQTQAKRFRFLSEAAAWRYRAQGVLSHWQVRERLTRDTFYRELLASNRLPMEGNLLALGCGQGISLALLASALGLGMVEGARRGKKPRLLGMESCPQKAESARLALGGEAEIINCDIISASLPSCSAVILQDVLLYLEPENQAKLLERSAHALEQEGLIIIRETDIGCLLCRMGIRLADWLMRRMPGGAGKHSNPRSVSDWKTIVESLGLQTESIPTGFCKTLLLARKTTPRC